MNKTTLIFAIFTILLISVIAYFLNLKNKVAKRSADEVIDNTKPDLPLDIDNFIDEVNDTTTTYNKDNCPENYVWFEKVKECVPVEHYEEYLESNEEYEEAQKDPSNFTDYLLEHSHSRGNCKARCRGHKSFTYWEKRDCINACKDHFPK